MSNGAEPGRPTTYKARADAWHAHFTQFFQALRLAPFPVLKTRRSSSKIKYSESFPVNCIFGLIESTDHGMVECFDWFRIHCLEEAVQQQALHCYAMLRPRSRVCNSMRKVTEIINDYGGMANGCPEWPGGLKSSNEG